MSSGSVHCTSPLTRAMAGMADTDERCRTGGCRSAWAAGRLPAGSRGLHGRTVG